MRTMAGANGEKNGRTGGWLGALVKTRQGLVGRIRQVLSAGPPPQELYDELEAILIQADVGVAQTSRILDRVRRHGFREPDQVVAAVREELAGFLLADRPGLQAPAGRLTVVMVVGVNGTGKTTTIAKLAHRLRKEGKVVILGAADTFRAAAIDQLVVWGERAGADVIRQQEGSDPAAVAYDAVRAAVAREADYVFIDTAGRLHTSGNLMAELKKVRRVIGREVEGAPHEVFLVLDATAGQNALQQARLFHEAVGVTGIVLTKLDGTARGGIVVAIEGELGLPVRFVGTGEGLDDLEPFNPGDFVAALFH